MKEKPVLLTSHDVLSILDERKTQIRFPIKFAHPTYASPGFLAQCDLVSFDGSHVRFKDNVSWSSSIRFPFGQIGDYLWGKETWQASAKTELKFGNWYLDVPKDFRMEDSFAYLIYRADLSQYQNCNEGGHGFLLSSVPWLLERYDVKWLSSTCMLRWASRIQLKIKNIRVERLHDISESDAINSGVDPLFSKEDIYKPTYRGELDLQPMPYKNYLWHGMNKTNIADEWEYQYSSYGRARDSYLSLWQLKYARKGYPVDLNPWVWVVDFESY